MIYSMTGYGGAKGEENAIAVTVELKSVNNRFLDVSSHLPRGFLFLEEPVRSAVSAHVSRGKVDVFVTLDTTQAEQIDVTINDALAEGYASALRTLSERFELCDDLTASALARFPEVLSVRKQEADTEAVGAAVTRVLEQALIQYDAMRAREGQKLCDDLLSKLDCIEHMVEQIKVLSPATVAEYRDRLYQKLSEVMADRSVDDARVLQEAAIFADRVAVDEEMVRLGSHIAQFRELLAAGSPVGRKLDFLIQEMNREANTTGSKCTDAAVAKIVIDLKSEIEKLREQIQNLE